METTHLVLGATGSIGYAFAKTLLENETPVTILVRNKEKALKLFGNTTLVEIIEGDAMDVNQLNKVAADKQFIFHGVNYPYDKWEKNMEQVTRNVINAVTPNKATILFPGNIYEYGNVAQITEDMVPEPTTKKGLIRLSLFNLLKSAAKEGKCKVIFMRLPDFFGPNVTNGLIKPVFGNAAKKKAINWLINADIPHQFVYTPDAARLMYLICKKKDVRDFTNYNYGGYVFSSLKELAKQISIITNGPDKVNVLPKWIMNTMALFMPVMKELKENYYLFENNVELVDKKVLNDYPGFDKTPVDVAIKETIDWFGKNF